MRRDAMQSGIKTGQGSGVRTPIFMFRLKRRWQRLGSVPILLGSAGFLLLVALLLPAPDEPVSMPEKGQDGAKPPVPLAMSPQPSDKRFDRMEAAAAAALRERPGADLSVLPPFEVPGPLRSIDGTTFRRGDDVVRIAGIEGPRAGDICQDGETRWSCGLQARAALHNMVAGRSLFCRPRQMLANGGLAADCRLEAQAALPQGDIAHLLVSEGWARPVPDEEATFAHELDRARGSQAGLWRGGWRLLSP